MADTRHLRWAEAALTQRRQRALARDALSALAQLVQHRRHVDEELREKHMHKVRPACLGIKPYLGVTPISELTQSKKAARYVL